MVKRLFDVCLAVIALALTGWLILVLFVMATLSTGQNGIFMQQRIGRYGNTFTIFKLRSMKNTLQGPVVTRFGRFLRRCKLDEFPQFYNVLTGDMSFVGPRPDIPGYYDALRGRDRELLKLKPGLTGPASIKYANEEYLLAKEPDPVYYNDFVLFPDKVRLNLMYLKKQSLWLDVQLLFCTLTGKLPKAFK